MIRLHLFKPWLLALSGIALETISHRQRLVSAFGGFYPQAARRVINESQQENNGKLITGVCSREEFTRWTHYEVYLNENRWLRADTEKPN